MLAIEVDYLLGRAVATAAHVRDEAEWPAHPTRLFSALVDALADLRATSAVDGARGEAALRWLETLEPPAIAGSVGSGDYCRRAVVKHWVPVNDEAMPKARGTSPLVERRKKQERFFPATVPSDPRLYFIWPNAEPTAEQRAGLDHLVARVPYLGHSSSVVRVACVEMDRVPEHATILAPGAGGGPRLRVPGPGRLDRLDAVFSVRRTDTLVQPPRGREVSYQVTGKARPHGPHGLGRVVSIDGPLVGLESVGPFVEAYRRALLSHLGDDAPEVLTGHAVRGERALRPHLAFVPLANVAFSRSDGLVKGLALVLPREVAAEDLAQLDDGAAMLRELRVGHRRWTLRYDVRDAPIRSLGFGRYAATAREWASVTPVALGLHPKPQKGLSFELALLRDLEQLGLGEQVAEIALSDVAFVRGAPRAKEFSRATISAVATRVIRHAWVRFAREVDGPLLVGAGRHMGFGLMVPWRRES